MTRERAEALREEYRKATAPWAGALFQHFDSEQQRQEHLQYVKDAQQAGAPF